MELHSIVVGFLFANKHYIPTLRFT